MAALDEVDTGEGVIIDVDKRLNDSAVDAAECLSPCKVHKSKINDLVS